MKKLFVLIALLFSLCAIETNAQRFTGTVIEVIDGQNFVVDAGRNVKMKVRLQFVDPPESSQPLYDVVKAHLSNMILNRAVTLNITQSTSDNVSIARVFVDETDVSMQLLRDGAAWYSVPEMQFQAESDRAEYLEAERLAKSEKRGVWGLTNVQPAWELRVARAKAEKEKEEQEYKDFVEKIARSGIAKIPYIGMSQFEFGQVCPLQPGDYESSTTYVSGRSYVTRDLQHTKERAEYGCYGKFSFVNRRLESVDRTVK